MQESGEFNGDIVVGADGDYPTINAAIEVAKSGQRIVVRPGVYRDRIVLDRGIQLVGDGPRDQCVIECAASPCVAIRREGAALRGLTIRYAGAADSGYPAQAVHVLRSSLQMIDCDVTAGPPHRDERTCILVGGEGESLIQRCRIHGSNTGVAIRLHPRVVIKECEIFASQDGIEIKSASGCVKASKIRDNALWGIYVRDDSSLDVENCEISNNGETGISVMYSEASIHHSSIHGNDKDGFMLVFGRGWLDECDISNHRNNVWCSDDADITVRRCNLHDGGLAGLTISGARGILEDCHILRNNALEAEIYEGGVEARHSADLVLRRCHVHDNKGAAVWVYQARVNAEDCDLRRNARGPWLLSPGSTVRESGNLG